MKIVKIQSLSDYRENVSNMIDRFVFRGVSDASFELIPKVGRYFNGKIKSGYNLSSQEMKEKEYELFKLFSLKSTEFQNIPEKGFYILALSQHHGLYTRLLDWTTDPFVAMYFALENLKLTKDCAIYAFENIFSIDTRLDLIEDGEKMENAEIGEDIINNPRYDESFFFLPPVFSPRISAQSGILQAFPEPTKPFKDEKLIKFVISGIELKEEIQQSLVLYGYNKYRLFPGLDGLCEYLNIKMEWKK